MASAGYGDISAKTEAGRFIVIIFIITSLIVIPTRISELQRLLSMRSPYSKAYNPSHSGDRHVNNKSKLKDFFKSFFMKIMYHQ